MEAVFFPGMEPRWDDSSGREPSPLPDELPEWGGALLEARRPLADPSLPEEPRGAVPVGRRAF